MTPHPGVFGVAAGVGIVAAAEYGAWIGFGMYVGALVLALFAAAAWCAWRDAR